MRSFLAMIGAMWFAIQAWTIGDGSVGMSVPGDGSYPQVLGDPAVMAIHSVARVLFVGFAIIALALIDWTKIAQKLGSLVDDVSVAPGP